MAGSAIGLGHAPPQDLPGRTFWRPPSALHWRQLALLGLELGTGAGL